MKLVVALLLFIFLGGAAVAWNYFESRNEPANSAAVRDEYRDIQVEQFFAQTPVDVTAKELVRLWKTNEVAARERFLGRPLRISGHVERVSVEQLDKKEFPTLYFTEGGVCAFNWGASQPELAQLHRGQHVIVIGQPRGVRPGAVGHLTTHCRLESYDQ